MVNGGWAAEEEVSVRRDPLKEMDWVPLLPACTGPRTIRKKKSLCEARQKAQHQGHWLGTQVQCLAPTWLLAAIYIILSLRRPDGPGTLLASRGVRPYSVHRHTFM